jgi:hypothetical protein
MGLKVGKEQQWAVIEPKVMRQQSIIGLVSSHLPKELQEMNSLVAEEESDGYLEHLHQRSVWDPAKKNSHPSFSY